MVKRPRLQSHISLDWSAGVPSIWSLLTQRFQGKASPKTDRSLRAPRPECAPAPPETSRYWRDPLAASNTPGLQTAPTASPIRILPRTDVRARPTPRLSSATPRAAKWFDSWLYSHCPQEFAGCHYADAEPFGGAKIAEV